MTQEIYRVLNASMNDTFEEFYTYEEADNYYDTLVESNPEDKIRMYVLYEDSDDDDELLQFHDPEDN